MPSMFDKFKDAATAAAKGAADSLFAPAAAPATVAAAQSAAAPVGIDSPTPGLPSWALPAAGGGLLLLLLLKK